LGTRLAELYVSDANPLATARLNDPEKRFQPCILPWADRAAHECYRELTQWVERELDDDMGKQAYLGRIAEIAVQLATIRAAGRLGARARVELADIEWGVGLAHAVTMTMMERSTDCFAQTPRGEFADRLIRIIQRRGEVTRREQQNSIRSRYRTQEINDMLAQAIEAGLIVRTPSGYRAGN